MTEQTPNIPLLRKAVEWAEAEAAKPAELCEWVQESYIAFPQYLPDKEPQCGTCFCIAGYVGASLDARYAEHEEVDGLHISYFAADALGIPESVASEPGGLFWDGNSIEDVRRVAESIAGERL